MRNKFLVLGIPLGVLAVGVALAGSASAATTSGVAAGRGTSKIGGLVQISAYSNNDGPKSRFVLTGAIADYGVAVRTYEKGASATQYDILEVKGTRGSFEVEIATLEARLVSAFNSFPSNQHTCSGLVVVHARAPVATGSGTGDYKGIKGTFTLSVSINEVDSWPSCPSTSQSLLSQSVVLTGSGRVSFTSSRSPTTGERSRKWSLGGDSNS